MSESHSSVEVAREAIRGLRDDEDDSATLSAHARVVWNVLAEPGDGVAGRAIAAFGPSDALRRVVDGRWDEIEGVSASELSQAVARWTPRLDSAAVRASTHAARRAGVRLLVPGDPLWPQRLDDLGAHRPVVLWVRGDPGILTDGHPTVAVVGARAATSYGEHVASELAEELAAAGATVVSGAAYGIDGFAHRSALRVGGKTVALLAGGVDRPYPAGHTALIDAIAASGALIAETPCGTPPTKWRFLARNRLIAALSDATVVVEAGARSGSLNTAAHAAALGRPLGAVPGAVTSAASAGCHRIIREYDGTLVTGPGDVRELLGMAPTAAFDLGTDRTDEVSRLLDALSVRQSRPIFEIARRSGLSQPEVQALVSLASIAGDAVECDDGWRRAASSR
ncbi:DNA-processing protein DprA [Microbacterium sp. P06]|uniref:DNA-processing protein DprA n=1 Tax=Microbacterium sp. P06 TaxID=3366949 RepID=UPI003745D428